ncbi:MAG: ABC transporter permease [bacterium]|nr:ABC transporter permease [bacterium]
MFRENLKGTFELRRQIPRRTFQILVGLSFLGAALFYAWFSAQGFVNAHFVPTPGALFTAAVEIFQGEDVWTDLQYSFIRVSAGFLIAALIAVPLGILIGAFRFFEALLQPLTEFARYVPVPALIPLLMVFFGIEETPKVMLIFVGVFFQLLLMVADEVRRVAYDLLQVSYTLGAKRLEVIGQVLTPAALPGIFDALRLCNGWAWTYLVVAELIAASEGLGYRILRFYRYKQIEEMYVYLILLGVFGLFLDYLFRVFNRRAFRWAETVKH